MDYTTEDFEDVTLEFEGETYTVPSDRIWQLLMQLENVMGYDYLIQRLAVNDVPSMHVYQAYAIALRAGGHKTVTAQMVKRGVDKQQLYVMAFALAGILRMTQPPSDIEALDSVQKGEPKQPVKKKAASARRTKRG